MVQDPVMMIGLAFVLGYLVRQVGLPPLVGFLAAGFLLRGFADVEFTEGMGTVADLGVTLMLFTIGLKLRVKDLVATPVWLGTTLQMLASIALFYPLLLAAGGMGIPIVSDLTPISALIVAFALSFSSTVFAVVMFQTKGETNADYARIAVGILIMQDIFAVAFLSASKGIVPSWWAIPVVLGLVALRKPMQILLARSGHGELLILSGLLLPLMTFELFELVHLKGDLGALFVGLLLAGSKPAEDLAKLLFGFKEFLLVTFFLSIGLRGDPSWSMLGIGAGLLLLLPLKAVIFYLILMRLNVMARPGAFTTLSLTNYSEFGLIVGALAASKGWIGAEWLLIFALALSASYIAAGPAYLSAERIFNRFANYLHPWEREAAKPPPPSFGDCRIVVVGLGRLGSAAAKRLQQQQPGAIVGLDFDEDAVAKRRAQGIECVLGDGSDHEFWQDIDMSGIDAVLVTMPNQLADLSVVQALREVGYKGFIGVTTAYQDDDEAVLKAGADAAHSMYDGAANTVSDTILMELNLKTVDPNLPGTTRLHRPSVDKPDE